MAKNWTTKYAYYYKLWCLWKRSKRKPRLQIHTAFMFTRTLEIRVSYSTHTIQKTFQNMNEWRFMKEWNTGLYDLYYKYFLEVKVPSQVSRMNDSLRSSRRTFFLARLYVDYLYSNWWSFEPKGVYIAYPWHNS